MMVPRKSGLIINISSIGSMMYFFNCAYGAGKAAVDKMAHDCAQELKKHNVTMFSLWPGPVKTEKVQDVLGKVRQTLLVSHKFSLVIKSALSQQITQMQQICIGKSLQMANHWNSVARLWHTWQPTTMSMTRPGTSC